MDDPIITIAFQLMKIFENVTKSRCILSKDYQQGILYYSQCLWTKSHRKRTRIIRFLNSKS